MRVELTKSRAASLLAGREALGMSQYALADALGWPRAKIKRLERGETVTIQESDLLALEAMFAGGRPVPQKAPKVPRKKWGSTDKLFTRVKRLPRQRGSENTVFFRVRMKVEIHPDQLSGRHLDLEGVKGCVHGVAHTKRQVPLRVGDEVVIMLWGPGIARRQRNSV
jgi:transcriptional regulator with XRE-family HTH domain